MKSATYLKDKNKVRCIMTNKLVGNKEVVTIDNAIDYVKKQGYIVVRPKSYKTLLCLCSAIIVLLLMSFASAIDNDGLYEDCSLYGNCEPFRGIISQSSSGNVSGIGTPPELAYFVTNDTISSVPNLKYQFGILQVGTITSFTNNQLWSASVDAQGSSLSNAYLLNAHQVTQTNRSLNNSFSGSVFAPNICYKDGTNCTSNLTNIAFINESNNFTRTQYLKNGAEINKVIRLGNDSVSNSTSGKWDFFVGDDFGLGTTTLHIEPEFTGGQYMYIGGPAGRSVYALVTTYVSNWIDVPSSMIQLTASNAGGYCQGRTCSVVGNTNGDFVIYKSNGNFITTQHISDGTSQPFDFKTYYNTSSYAGGWDNKGAMFNFDTQGSANTFPNNISLATFKVAGVTKANLTSDGSLILNGNVTANIYKNSSGASGITASGTSCTITAITGGIITGATCI